MKNKNCGTLCKIITVLGIIIGVLTIIGAIATHWDELRKIFSWMPDFCGAREKFEDDEYDEFNDFADL